MPRESNLEVKVGAFVVVAVIALVAFIFSISDFSALFQKGTTLKAVFQYGRARSWVLSQVLGLKNRAS